MAHDEIVRLARRYYPVLWDDGRIAALVEAGKLTKAEADEITGAARPD